MRCGFSDTQSLRRRWFFFLRRIMLTATQLTSSTKSPSLISLMNTCQSFTEKVAIGPFLSRLSRTMSRPFGSVAASIHWPFAMLFVLFRQAKNATPPTGVAFPGASSNDRATEIPYHEW